MSLSGRGYRQHTANRAETRGPLGASRADPGVTKHRGDASLDHPLRPECRTEPRQPPLRLDRAGNRTVVSAALAASLELGDSRGTRRCSYAVIGVGAGSAAAFLALPTGSVWQVGSFFLPMLLAV